MPYTADRVKNRRKKPKNKNRKKDISQPAPVNPCLYLEDTDSEYFSASEEFGERKVAGHGRCCPKAAGSENPARQKAIHDAQKVELFVRHLEQPDGWTDENGRRVPFYTFEFEGADLLPFVISRLPGFAEASIVLRIRIWPKPTADNPSPASYVQEFPELSNEEGRTTASLIIELERVNDNHYYPIVSGKPDHSLGGDGKCLFYSIWRALDRTADSSAKDLIYSGNVPKDKETGAARLRGMVIAHLRENPAEFADFLAGGMKAPFGSNSAAACRPHRSNNRDPLQISAESFNSEIPASVDTDKVRSRQPYCDFGEERFDFLSESFLNSAEGIDHIVPAMLERAVGLVQEIPFALMEIAKAIVQFVGEAVSRQAIPAATKACLPHLQRYIPLATASPLLISLLDASHTRKRLRALLLFISIILPFVYPAWATYAIITRLLCTLDIAISDDNWRDRGLTLFLAAHYALQLPVSSEYAGRILASIDNEYGFLRNIDWIFTLEQKLATSDPGIAIALFSACAAYQLLLADKITRSSDGSKKGLTYVVDYLTSASRIGAEMEIAASAGSNRLARDFDDFVCRHLSTTGPEGERFFSGIKITANGDSVAGICARAGSSGVNSDAATGDGLLAYALSRCEHFYSDQGLDTQLWAADRGIPADLLAAMATCEAIRSFADERRDRNEATRAGATPGSLNVPWFTDSVAEPHRTGGRGLEAIEAVIVREISRITSPFVTAFPDKPRPINISSWVANADYSASLSASTKADEALRFQPGSPPTSMAQERAPLDASTATSAGEAVALLDQTANTLERLNAVLAAAACLILSRRGGLTVVATGVSLSTIIWAVIKARKGWRDERREHLPPQAAPFQNEQVSAQIDPGNKNLFEWVFHSWGEFSALETAITTVFDNGLFERTMLLMWTDGPAPLLDYQESIYGNAARIASADYSSDKKNSSATLLSSESRYGKELYQLLNSPVSSTVLPKIDKIVSLLIKVKTYETCRWRDLYGELKVGNIASAVKLEAIFSMRDIPYVIRPSEFELRKFMRSKLENTTATKIDEDCRQGCELALALYTSLVAENSGASAFSHEAILADAKNASSTIFSMISAGQDYLYNFRGTFCLPALKNKQKELLQYHYAAMYLPLLVADSQGFLDILVNLKNRFPKASSASASAMVLESRALAINEAIWKFTSETDKPKVRYLSTKELLDNYAGLVSSGEDVLYFISLVEAIFLWIKQGGRVEDLYREAGDPTKIIKRFRRAMELLPTSKAAHLRGIEGVSYLQNIKTSGETVTDIEYFSQFSFFKKTHLNSVSAFIAIDKLTQLWLSPYELVTLRPVRCVRLSLVFDMVFYSDPPALIRDHYRGGRTAVGELAFCQLESGSWILVAKIGNNLFLKKISHATMTGNPALNKINLEQPSTPFNPRIQLNHKEWQGAELEKLVFIPLFSNKFPPDKMTYQSPEMRMLFDDKKSGPQARLGSHPLLFEIVQDYAASLLGDALAQSKNEKYIKSWWQYITPMIPGFDITYHSYHDADYTPSFGEITWEVVNGAMLVTTLGIPAGELLYGEVGALRNSLLINAHQGFRGMALVSRVLSDVGTDVARASLRATTMAVSYFISPWEPVPLELIGMALYKGIRRLMRGKFVLKQKLPRDFVPAAPESGKGSDVKPPATDRTPQIFRTDFANEPKFYELNYEQEPEVLLGAGNDPHPGRSGEKQPDKLPGATETSAWNGDPGTLENRGSINLREGPRTRTIQTPFQFSRSDLQFRSSGPVSSIHPIVDSGIHRLRLGQARDIVLSQFGQELPFSVDAARPGNNADVVVLPPGNKGVTGILINFADILTDHPLIVSPGPILNSVFVMAVSEQNNIVVFYHLSEPHLDPLALGSHDPVIRRLFEVHNSLLEEFHTQLAIPDDVSMVDIHLLAGQFEYADIAYADPSEKAGFQDAAPGEPVSRKSALRSASRHMSSGGNSRIFNYALLGSDAQFSSSEGRIFYSLSRDTENRIRIRGRTEIAGELDDEFKITPAATASQIETDEITEEIQALMRSDLQFSHFARIPTLLKPSDLKDLAKTFLPYKYETHFRLLKVWPPAGSASGTARLHILLVLHKNGYAYAVDIAATSFQDKGIASPIFESDNTWRVIYQTHLHDHVGVFQDFSDFKLFNSRVEAGLGSATAYDDVNDPSWEVLSRPPWLLSESNRMLVDAINVDREVAISTVEAGLSPEIPRISTPARSLQPFAIRWLNAVEDDSFNEAIKGAADIANMEVIEHHLMSYNIRTVIYTTLIYQKITDENPLLVFSIAAMDNKKVMYMIDPAARREGRYSSLFSWDDWVEYRSNGISISRKYRQAATVRKDFVFQNMNIGRIGTGNFF